jgi:hypothetical protein
VPCSGVSVTYCAVTVTTDSCSVTGACFSVPSGISAGGIPVVAPGTVSTTSPSVTPGVRVVPSYSGREVLETCSGCGVPGTCSGCSELAACSGTPATVLPSGT